jgi:hypothetical protein
MRIEGTYILTEDIKRLVAGFPPRRPWGRFSPSTSVSPANLHSTKFSIIIITRGRYNRPFSGRRAEWTQFGHHPPLCEFKKKQKTAVSSYSNFNTWWWSPEAGTIGHSVADVPSGPSLDTTPHYVNLKKKQQKTAVPSYSNFNTWWWSQWSKHVVINF